jgi:membrane associated rhomboid family serine protease
MEKLATTRIPARSHRQALDWGLVLASQGIEAAIECGEGGSSWGLVVPAADSERALRSLRLYHVENRGWPWQRRVLQPGYLFDWASLAWVLLVSLFFALDAHRDLRAAGALDTSLLPQGQWWRLLTAVWLHGDLAHLATNATFGFVLLGLAMGRYGTGAGLLAAYLGGAAGNVASWLLAGTPHRGLGASGMVMAALGLLAAQALAPRRGAGKSETDGVAPKAHGQGARAKVDGQDARATAPATAASRKLVLAGLFAGVMLFVLLGLKPGADILAHLGGFVGGLLLGALLSRTLGPAQKAGLNLLCGFLFALLLLVPWWLALRNP